MTWQSTGALRPGTMADDAEAEELKKAKKEKRVRAVALVAREACLSVAEAFSGVLASKDKKEKDENKEKKARARARCTPRAQCRSGSAASCRSCGGKRQRATLCASADRRGSPSCGG